MFSKEIQNSKTSHYKQKLIHDSAAIEMWTAGVFFSEKLLKSSQSLLPGGVAKAPI